MGEEVNLLLDTDCCPRCEKGTVTATQPQCNECGFSVRVYPKMIRVFSRVFKRRGSGIPDLVVVRADGA